MHLRSWQLLGKCHTFPSFWTPYTTVSTNHFLQHLVSGNLNLIYACLSCFIYNFKVARNIVPLIFATEWWYLIMFSRFVVSIFITVVRSFSWPDWANKVGSLSASTLPVLHEGGQNCGLFSVFGILQECHHWSYGKSIWCDGGIYWFVSFQLNSYLCVHFCLAFHED